jgi:type I restriction enzyme, R subunit
VNEAETRAELIDPALKAAGWGVVEGSRARLEMICLGRVGSGGGKSKTADYVLTYRGHRLAVIEAKAVTKGPTDGLGQAKDYAVLLQARLAFSTNGKRIYRVDMATGKEGYVDSYPSPQELWDWTFTEANEWRDRFADVPFEEKGGSWIVRYYQHNAIDAVLEAIAKGRHRILLTLATGTGKTAIAFQIAWKLFHARWNISGEPIRRPRILFLADRNILADQAYNAFSAFPEDALARITPADIRKKGRVPKNASVFFTIFQTFMSGIDDNGDPAPYFGDYPPDFFDFIVVDECHRGGADDESQWRVILQHFAPAVQLGLTATPKRTANVDTYAYFGEPVYTYSLKEGIEDGFLTPFKVRQIKTSIDDYTYTPDDVIVSGEAEAGDYFEETKFNRSIIIPEREEYRVRTFLDMVDQKQKTLIFCASQSHAAMVRDLVNQMKTSADPNYCVRVTADEGGIGDTWLRAFQDNEKTIPTILTTSHKLSTGVDARNVRNIVLMRPIKSMIEFKQIIGRGTRLYEGKEYFTIIDFVDAYKHFNDPEWDGEPMEPPTKVEPGEPRREPKGPPEPTPPSEPREPLLIKLADGKVRKFQHISATSFWGPDGKPMSAAQFVESLFGVLPQLFKDEAELRKLWSDPETRKRLLEGLAERGFTRDQLNSIRSVVDAEASDLFDVLAYVAYVRPPETREERVATRRSVILDGLDRPQREFLDFVLSQYVAEGEQELDPEKLPGLLHVRYGSSPEGLQALGGSVREVQEAFRGFQGKLYAEEPKH